VAAAEHDFRQVRVLTATCGDLPVVLGAAPASALFELSFADVLDESADTGYQRPFDEAHSKEFRSYIERPGATTIPLTLNLRGPEGAGWRLRRGRNGEATLSVRVPRPGAPPVMARVDCQHRLGMMAESAVQLTFQCFLGLSVPEEMAIFNVINGKAKGLSSSLLDYHTTKLVEGYEATHLELYVAKRLNEDPRSVWRGTVKLGGVATQGSHRRVSLRGLQSATKLLLKHSLLGPAQLSNDEVYGFVRDYWRAIAATWPSAWRDPRRHQITKGVGVTALSLLGADIINACLSSGKIPTEKAMKEYLHPLGEVDWSNAGIFKGFGGRAGAARAHDCLRNRLFGAGTLLRAAK
jgi:DNA sulfur modification protein DndB